MGSAIKAVLSRVLHLSARKTLALLGTDDEGWRKGKV